MNLFEIIIVALNFTFGSHPVLTMVVYGICIIVSGIFFGIYSSEIKKLTKPKRSDDKYYIDPDSPNSKNTSVYGKISGEENSSVKDPIDKEKYGKFDKTNFDNDKKEYDDKEKPKNNSLTALICFSVLFFISLLRFLYKITNPKIISIVDTATNVDKFRKKIKLSIENEKK